MKITINTPDGIEEYESESSGPNLLEVAQSDVEAGDIYEGVQLLEDISAEATRVCREFELGSISGVPEFKAGVKKHCWRTPFGKKCFNRPAMWTRRSKLTLFASACVSVPTSNDGWKILRACAAEAVGAGVLAGIITSPAAAIPAVKVAMVSCLQRKGMAALANSLELGLFTRQTTDGDWTEV